MKKLDFRKYYLIIVLLFLVPIHVDAQNGWTRKKDLPTPRAGASASVIDNKIYVIGGYMPSPKDLSVNEVYDPLTDSWETKQAIPTKRDYLLTCVVNDTIYALGGGEVNSNKNEAYDPKTDTWTTKANLPLNWYGVYGDTIGEMIYIMGGNYNRQNCFAYNPKTNIWTEETPIPSGGCKGTLSATACNGLIYTFGGATNYPNGAMNTVNVYNPNTDTWEFKTHMPTPRYSLRTFLVNGKIYAIGGSQGSGSALSTVEVYNPETDTWERKSNMPFKVAWFTGAVFNNKIYIFGGTPDWTTGGNEVWEYDPSLDTPKEAWTKKADKPKAAGSASVVDGKIYVIGGSVLPAISDAAYNDVYDPSTNIWEEKAPVPTARGFLTTAVVNDTIYAIGGGWPVAKNAVEAYDPATNTWTKKQDMLINRLGMDAAVIDGIIYIFGGNYTSRNCEAFDPATNTWTKKTDMPEGGGVVSVTVYNELIYVFGGGYYSSYSFVQAYDPKTDTWIKKKDMPTPRFAFQTFLVGEKIYAMGGVKSEGGASLATVEVYDPVADTWETKPNMPINLAWFTGAVVNDKIYITGGTRSWAANANFSVWEYDPSFNTPVAAGNVSGTWPLANSPYHINGEVTVPNGETLTIEPGVEVVFTGHFKFNVQGRLLAVGTKKDSIRFTSEDKETGWHGIRFTNTSVSNDTSRIIYCSFKYGNANTGTGFDRCGGAMLIKDFDKVYVSNCIFDSNKQQGDGWNPPESTGGIYIYHASPIITKNTFSNNYSASKSSAVACVNCPNAIVSNNIFENNKGVYSALAFVSNSKGIISGNIISNNIATNAGGGILIDCALVSGSTSPLVENNIIIHNQGLGGGGICCYINANPVLINNTIAYNSARGGGGIYFDGNSDGIFINNILFGNSATTGNQVYINDAGSDPVFKYCDVQGGKEGFAGSGAGVNYTGTYENNIDADPLFKDTASMDYNLSELSHCLGTGIDSIELLGKLYHSPQFDFNGNPRPGPAGSKPDMGAFESLLNNPYVGIDQKLLIPNEVILYQNYPNPFNSKTEIQFVIPESSFVTLKVFDITGKQISCLVNEKKPAGTSEVTWHTGNLPGGVYFYQLNVGGNIETRKMLLLK